MGFEAMGYQSVRTTSTLYLSVFLFVVTGLVTSTTQADNNFKSDLKWGISVLNGMLKMANNPVASIKNKDSSGYLTYKNGALYSSEHAPSKEDQQLSKKYWATGYKVSINNSMGMNERHRKALAYYNDALTVDANSLKAWLSYGWSSYKLGYYERSINAYLMSMYLGNDKNDKVWKLLGLAYEKNNSPDIAQACFDEEARLKTGVATNAQASEPSVVHKVGIKSNNVAKAYNVMDWIDKSEGQGEPSNPSIVKAVNVQPTVQSSRKLEPLDELPLPNEVAYKEEVPYQKPIALDTQSPAVPQRNPQQNSVTVSENKPTLANRYVLQVGAFSSAENGKRKLIEIKNEFREARLEKVGSMYLVLIGEFDNKQAAMNKRSSLGGGMAEKFYVKRL